ncbi:hypothetical protein [Streptomyces sp. 351MFTsu5.1]|uniref:phage fiber-tail adaptor protein n=1 Tax=Streptomyces sp. 351MFTsu5.1 TaxID=1172180 RepID=UPI0003817B9E|nr:hypothetical protein [Streptomyces sp. 351MFTsu5.1]
MPQNFTKDPVDLLPYTWDWGDWLTEVGDTISSATVTVPEGLTADGAATFDETSVTQRIAGGTVDETYTVSCQITTAGGLIDKWSIYITIREQ